MGSAIRGANRDWVVNTATDADQALANLQRMTSRGRNTGKRSPKFIVVRPGDAHGDYAKQIKELKETYPGLDVLVLDGTNIRRDVLEALKFLAAEEADTVAFVGHNHGNFLQLIREIAEQGALVDKNIKFISCGDEQDTPQLIKNLLRRRPDRTGKADIEGYGALSVEAFRQPISRNYLKPLVEHLLRLSTEEDADPTLFKAIDSFQKVDPQSDLRQMWYDLYRRLSRNFRNRQRLLLSSFGDHRGLPRPVCVVFPVSETPGGPSVSMKPQQQTTTMLGASASFTEVVLRLL